METGVTMLARSVVGWAIASVVLGFGPVVLGDAAQDKFNFAMGLLISKDYESAVEEFETFLKRFPNSDKRPQAAYGMADAWMRAGEPDRAIAAYQAALKQFPKAEEAPIGHYNLARSHLALKQHEKALAAFRAALADSDKQTREEATVGAAECCIQLEQFREAATLYSAFQKAFPKSSHRAAVSFSHGWALSALGEHKDAVGIFDAFLREFPESADVPKARLALSDAHVALGQHAQAAAALEPLAKSGAMKEEVLLRQAWNLFRSGDKKEAAALFERFVEQFPKSPLRAAALYNAGVCRLGSGEFAEAVKWYRKAAEAGEGDAMNNLGAMYANGKGVREDDVEAIRWFREAAKAGNSEAMKNLGGMYAEGQGVPADRTVAVQWYRKAAEAGHPVGMSSLAWHYECGRGGLPVDKKQALTWYEKAAQAGNAYASEGVARLRADVAKQEREIAEEREARDRWLAVVKKADAAKANGDVKAAVKLIEDAKAGGVGGAEAPRKLAELYASPEWKAVRPKIGIMEFKVSQKLDPAFGEFLYDCLMEQLHASGKYRIVDWEEIDRVLKYIATSQPNVSSEDARLQAAMNQHGIQQMYIGSIIKIGSKFHIKVKVLKLDLTVERIEKASVTSEDKLETAMTGIAQRLLATR